jgi:formylglycine-generating enzyme required for sulfatase activity
MSTSEYFRTATFRAAAKPSLVSGLRSLAWPLGRVIGYALLMSLTFAVASGEETAAPRIIDSGKLTQTGPDAKIQVTVKPIELTNSIGMKLTQLPAGEFRMGADEQQITRQLNWVRKHAETKTKEAREDPEKLEAIAKYTRDLLEQFRGLGPQHRVVITKPFFLGTCPVTQKEFATVMGYNPSDFSAKGRQKDKVVGTDTSRFPVEMVSWETADEFCRQLAALPEEAAAGRTYRLPTEAEWEYACRAGTTTEWFWDHIGRDKWSDFCWLKSNDNGRPHPVGEKRPNPWGLFDMVGNVRVWCADWYDPKAYAASPLREPAGPVSGSRRVRRGAHYAEDWNSGATTSAFREGCAPVWTQNSGGFRIACDVKIATPPHVEPTPRAESPVSTKPTPEGQDPLTQLAKKGLVKRAGYFVLPDEAPFVRYSTTIDRLRVACFHAQRECQDVQQHLDRAKTVQANVLNVRMRARTYMNYSEDWREYRYAERARNNATDALMIADLSKEDVEKWKKDADGDFHRAVDAFGNQCQTLRQMLEKLRKEYVQLAHDVEVERALAEVNNQGNTQYRLGPTPNGIAAARRLEHEEEVHQQLQAK